MRSTQTPEDERHNRDEDDGHASYDAHRDCTVPERTCGQWYHPRVLQSSFRTTPSVPSKRFIGHAAISVYHLSLLTNLDPFFVELVDASAPLATSLPVKSV